MSLNADQQALVGLCAEIMAGRCANEQLAKTEVSQTRVDTELWRELAEAGLLGIAVPEALGGAGLGFTELCLLLEQQGRFLAPVPLWENLLATYVLVAHGTPEQQRRWVPPVVAGTGQLGILASLDAASPVSCADGALHGQALVTSRADALVVVTEEGVYLCTEVPSGVPVVTTNHALAFDTDLTGVPAVRLDADVDSVLNHLRLGLAATALGVADAGIREAAQHLSQREQFGRSLATFQATTFQLGDSYCDAQAMRATLWQGVWAIDSGPATRETAVACWYATEAAERIQHTVQHLHGGLGADTTFPVHRRLLWTMRTNALLGGPSRQLVRLGAALIA